ncbi:MAG: hypothetical protein RLZZ385_1965 [Pseudomonadota bacterium]|jgi:aminopeptidase N
MRDAQARTVYLKDYQPPGFLIDSTDLRVELYEDCALVRACLRIRRNDLAGSPWERHLVLHGEHLELEKLVLNERQLKPDQYQVDAETLTIPDVEGLLGNGADGFELTCHTRIEPQNNTALEGLYKSRTMFCTQCEAQGFRRITYYLDRPDVMSVFTTTVVAERARYPVLLSNGNMIDAGADPLDDKRHWVTWHDPYPKPCYLFALVAGNLEFVEDHFRTRSGRDVVLRIFVERKDLDKCDHAMASLKHAMRWDEEVYGREYDLDIFMIVAVDDFNMGAMENKGLNIFNTSCVLANPKTTVDAAFQRVEAVVAHEYFHNWSGNRVTCRDWFQLSLKEGFTVFRDSEFSADMGSRTVKRVEDVALLRTAQFAEDAGPMAHPVRPDSYMEISNFYTLTVYEKGAEVVRMISYILGPENFRKGTDLYFERHDGQAVTTEDFVRAMEEVSGIDLGQFRNWYTQAGTPVLDVSGRFDAGAAEYHLTVRQSCPPSPGQARKLPFHIPLRMGLLSREGAELPLRLRQDTQAQAMTDRVLHVTEPEQTFVFTNVSADPVPSLLRGFSAPVRLHFDYSPDDLVFLMAHDSDGFNRWNAAQQLGVLLLRQLQQDAGNGAALVLPQRLLQAYRSVLQSALDDARLDKAMVAQLLVLPTESYLIEIADEADVEVIHQVREFVARSLAEELQDLWRATYLANQDDGPFEVNSTAVARRALKNLALSYLSRLDSTEALDICKLQFDTADNMTDQSAALGCLVNSAVAQQRGLTDRALNDFYQQWQDEPLVVDLWLSTQARSPLPDTLDRVQQLMLHPAFNIRNPNKVRSVIGAFSAGSLVNFHHSSGSGYRFLADQVITLNTINPQIASRLLTPLTRWRKFDKHRAALMKAELIRIKGEPALSKDVFEVVEKSLA